MLGLLLKRVTMPMLFKPQRAARSYGVINTLRVLLPLTPTRKVNDSPAGPLNMRRPGACAVGPTGRFPLCRSRVGLPTRRFALPSPPWTSLWTVSTDQ
jgi:hypothetical protein